MIEQAVSLRLCTLCVAVFLDWILPEPPASIHPVVWFGRLVTLAQRFAPLSPPITATLAGLLLVLVAVALTLFAGWWITSTVDSYPLLSAIVVGIGLRTTFTVRGLARAATDVRDKLAAGRLDEARFSARSLVSRDTKTLSSSETASAAIESVAENTTDSFLGPWLAFALLGLPGAMAYRAVNTLDSMIGYRGEYEYFGKAAARLDDIVNLVPARLSAVCIAVSACVLSPEATLRSAGASLRLHSATASPNAGWTMGAMAGALGVSLEKRGYYQLNGGRQPAVADIALAVRVLWLTSAVGLLLASSLVILRYQV